MDTLDELIMDTDKLKTQITELSRSIDEMTKRIIALANMFANYHAVSDKRYLMLEKRVSRLESR